MRILAVSGMADKPDVIRELLRVKKAKYQTVPDVSNLLMRSFEIQELPTFFVVSGDGTIRDAFVGAPVEREADLAEKIEQELAKVTENASN